MTRTTEAERRQARTALLVLTTVWGSTFVVIQSALDVFSPFLLITLRFALAGLVLAALRPPAALAAVRILGTCLPLSLSMLVGFSLQTLGLLETTPARSAFLTSLAVIVVPLLDFVSSRRLPRPALCLAVPIATTGVLLLFHPLGDQWRRGDTLTALGAVAFAYYVVTLGRLSPRHDPTALVVAQSLTITVLAAPLCLLLERPRLLPGLPALGALLYLGVICTALTFLLMTWAQARVEPVEAAVIYTLEPVVAARFSLLLGRDAATTPLVAGGALVAAAMLLSGLPPPAAHRANLESSPVVPSPASRQDPP